MELDSTDLPEIQELISLSENKNVHKVSLDHTV
jgi:hypothetical protein